MNLIEAMRAVTKAGEDLEEMRTPSQWASLEVNWNVQPAPRVCIHYGPIHSNGMHERAIATRNYYIDKGEVTYYIQGHP